MTPLRAAELRAWVLLLQRCPLLPRCKKCSSFGQTLSLKCKALKLARVALEFTGFH